VGAFDTVFKPRGLTPNSTLQATLFTVGTDSPAGEDCQALVNVSVVGTAAINVRVGVIPSGGSVIWLMYDDAVESANPVIGLGPLFLQSGDTIEVRTDSANNVTFSVTGTSSSP